MLSNTEIEFFKDQGYLILSRLLDEARILELRELVDKELERAQSPETRTKWDLMEEGEQAVFRLSRAMRRHEAFQAVALDPCISEAARSLLGPDAAVCVNRHNMMLVKAPHVGRRIDWHQDGANWGTTRIISLTVFLDDASPDNGCLEIVSGVHRNGLLPSVSGKVGHGMNPDDPAQAALLRQALPVTARAGDGVFFHCCLPHFSGANTSDRSRRSFTFAYISESDRLPTHSTGMEPVETIPFP